jgi:hypothetical protein
MAHFQQVLKEIRAQVCVERRPLILDAENMFGGRYIIKEDRKAWFCKTLIDLVGEHDYGPVLV